MSDSDSAQRRRPPTIDLTAQEVETGRPAETAESSAASAASSNGAGKSDPTAGGSGPKPRRATPYIVSGVIGAVAVALVATGLWFAGLAPSRGRDTAQSGSGLPAAQGESGPLQKADVPSPVPAPPTPRATEAEAQTKALGDAVVALTHRVDEMAADTRDLAVQVKAASAAATTAAEEARAAAQNHAQSGDLDQIVRRLEAIENTVKTLSADAARASASEDDHVARAAVAAAALAAAVERGAPFSAELATVVALGADQNAIAALTPFAAGGLPSAAVLSRELIDLLPTLRQASVTKPKEASLIARLEINAQKLVRITRADSAATGDDPSSIVSRIEMDARNDDVASALAEISRLPEQPRATAADWTKKAQTREAALAASRRIAADAVTALAKPAQR